MCQTQTFKSKDPLCNHSWMVIVKQCAPGVTFGNTPVHHFLKFGQCFQKSLILPATYCPNCGQRGQYDANFTRIKLKRGQEGNCGNGYNMTDGNGNLLPQTPTIHVTPYVNGCILKNLGCGNAGPAWGYRNQQQYQLQSAYHYPSSSAAVLLVPAQSSGGGGGCNLV